MDLNLIKKLIKILEGSQVTDLEVEENGIRVKLAKKVRVTQSVAIPAASSVSPVSQQNIAPVVKSEEKKSAEETSHLHEIKSPIVGTFYRAPAPDGRNTRRRR